MRTGATRPDTVLEGGGAFATRATNQVAGARTTQLTAAETLHCDAGPPRNTPAISERIAGVLTWCATRGNRLLPPAPPRCRQPNANPAMIPPASAPRGPNGAQPHPYECGFCATKEKLVEETTAPPVCSIDRDFEPDSTRLRFSSFHSHVMINSRNPLRGPATLQRFNAASRVRVEVQAEEGARPRRRLTLSSASPRPWPAALGMRRQCP